MPSTLFVPKGYFSSSYGDGLQRKIRGYRPSVNVVAILNDDMENVHDGVIHNLGSGHIVGFGDGSEFDFGGVKDIDQHDEGVYVIYYNPSDLWNKNLKALIFCERHLPPPQSPSTPLCALPPTKNVVFHSLLLQTIRNRLSFAGTATNDDDSTKQNLFSSLILVLLTIPLLSVTFSTFEDPPAQLLAGLLTFQQNFSKAIIAAITYLQHHPIGLKLNTVLTTQVNNDLKIILGMADNATQTIFQFPVTSKIVDLILLSTTPFGIASILALLHDAISLLTAPQQFLSMTFAAITSQYLALGRTLFRIFQGKKINPLRNNRVDSYAYDSYQVLIGSFLQCIIAFMFTTMAGYSVVFFLVGFARKVIIRVLELLVAVFEDGVDRIVKLAIGNKARCGKNLSLKFSGKSDSGAFIFDAILS